MGAQDRRKEHDTCISLNAGPSSPHQATEAATCLFNISLRSAPAPSFLLVLINPRPHSLGQD